MSTTGASSSAGSTIRTMTLEQVKYEDLPPTVFSPTGRLHSVEKVQQAAEAPALSSNLLIAIRTSEGLVICSTIPSSPYTPQFQAYDGSAKEADKADDTKSTSDIKDDDEEETSQQEEEEPRYPFQHARSSPSSILSPLSPFMILSPHPFVIATAGNSVDGRVLRNHIRTLAEASSMSLFESNTLSLGTASPKGSSTSTPPNGAATLARMIADTIQTNTQSIGSNNGLGGLVASTAVLIQCDDDDGQIWQIDPTGQFWNCQATVVGCNAHVARAELFEALRSESSNPDESAVKSTPPSIQDTLRDLTVDDAIQVAKRCIRVAFKQKGPRGALGAASNNKPTSDASAEQNAAAAAARNRSDSVGWEALVLYNRSSGRERSIQIRRGSISPYDS